MKGWLVRLIVFGLLWVGLIFENNREGGSFSILLVACALSFAFYFFLPVARKPIWLYVILQGVLSSLVFLEVSVAWVGLLLLYVAMEAIFVLSVALYRLYIGYSSALLILLGIVKNEWSLTSLIFGGLFFFIAVLLNRHAEERKEQREVYEQLLGEYRRLKRMNLENEQVARLEERTRIARDIHDSVGHKLTALLMQLEMLSIQKKSTEYVDLKQLAMESLEETRQAVKTLQHEEVVGVASVLQLIRKLESENHLLVRFTTKQGILLTKLTNEQSVVLYRSIQEALTNTMKHGSSREVEVTLGRSAIGDVEWMISNQIDGPFPFEPGFGLTAMKERVEEQGGRLRVYQTDQKFIIEGSMPVKGTMA